MRESVWVRRMLEGDRGAGQRFVTAHYSRVYRLLLQLTGNATVAEDLAQQTFVRAWQGLAAFRGGASLATWLHRIAYREYGHWLRDRRDHCALSEADPLTAPGAETGVDGLALRQALDALPDDLREAFLLHYVAGLSVAEVAAVVEAPVGTVKWRLFEARRRLRQLLAEPEECIDRGLPYVPCE